jgi:hypothetical protein
MRDRCRELSTPSDDYDRAVICILDDFETLLAQLDHNTATMELARARIEALQRQLAARLTT